MKKQQVKNIGLLGGSFNPVTAGHIEIAKYALKLLDEVILIPCNNHSWAKPLIDFKHRFEMCQLAITKDMSVQDYELRYNLPGDTFSLIEKLKQDKVYKNSNLFFIIGADEANDFRYWKNFIVLSNMITFIVVRRPGVALSFWARSYFTEPHIILRANSAVPEISSSDIRKHFLDYYATGKVSSLLKRKLDPKVFDYIVKNGLYGKC